MKSIISLVCIVLVACALRGAQARPKRSVLLAASPVVASVPVVQTVSHVHHNPTTVVSRALQPGAPMSRSHLKLSSS